MEVRHIQKTDYEKYIYSLLSLKNKIRLNVKSTYNKIRRNIKKSYISIDFNIEDVLVVLTMFHKSITFSDEENYYNILKEDYEAYVADKTQYYKDLIDVIENTTHDRVTGDFFKNEYYLKCLKFADSYEYLNKEVKKEYKPYIRAGNSGIYGRFPALKSMEKNLINEAFRLLYNHYAEYNGGCRTSYISIQDYPYEYIGEEGVIELYKSLLMNFSI